MKQRSWIFALTGAGASLALAGCVLPLMFVSTQEVIHDEHLVRIERQALAERAIASALPTLAPEPVATDSTAPSAGPSATPTPVPTTTLSGVLTLRGVPAPNRTVYLRDFSDGSVAPQTVKTNGSGVYQFNVKHQHTYQVVYDVTSSLLGTAIERDAFYRNFARDSEIESFESVPLAIVSDPRRLDVELSWRSSLFVPEEDEVVIAARPGAHALEVSLETYEGAFEYELFLEGPDNEDFHEVASGPSFPGLVVAVPSYGQADSYEYHVLAHTSSGTVRSPEINFSLREQARAAD